MLERDGYVCQLCGEGAYSGHELDAAHIVARAKGGSDDEDNLMTAGRSCHRAYDARDAQAALAGFLRAGGGHPEGSFLTFCTGSKVS